MEFNNKDEVEAYLKQYTKLDWEPITPTYLRYKALYNHHDQFCLFAPGDWVHKYPYSRLYIPTNKTDLHDLRTFLGYLNNAKKEFIKAMPWVVVHFGPKTPTLCFTQLRFLNEQPMLIEYSLKFNGHIALRPIGSINEGKLSFYVPVAKQALASSLAAQCGNIEFNIMEKKLSFGAPIFGSNSENKLEVTPPNRLTAKLAPTRIITRNLMPGWEINGKLGYELSATFNPLPKEKPANTYSDVKQITADIEKFLCGTMKSIVVFVKEFGEGLANETPLRTSLAPPAMMYQDTPMMLPLP